MSNPIFQHGNKQLKLWKDTSGNFLCFEIKEIKQLTKGIILDKSQVQDLIAQLQSWATTGDWIKPKKKFVFIENGKALPNIQEAFHKAEIVFMGEGREIYELTDDNKVK